MNQIKNIVDDCMTEMWKALDPHNTGVLDKNTARYFVNVLTVAIEAQGGQVEPFDFDNDFDDFDADQDGKVNQREMRSFVEQVMGVPLIFYFRHGGGTADPLSQLQCVESL
ncbi:unnamed protein product [Aphanomyces euteiches]|uniref:EF-hand domain-containing protein n=1 Tax=Aphanomyces euteiches TaxID=100861 RepID=A0A6G0XJP8_9STRA|nr:hypothetical protein Ae201684_004127 [Aphanomyces euteiches]KAH9094028.1 hypothetical protein Ae201684P_016645 [Aphanomyces euteiches]KAH9097877.1 hypothetical protein LEN26_016939 [Aphanomyces euteiches]KAH9123957.1 hypothetical protein AeMF1_005168 [Aphanomyces euteiches]KAH9143341.1 hypothetical protein AeRB84_012658 [Aphanomyces euteiches]